MEIEQTPFHLGRTVRSAVDLCALQAQEKGLTVSVGVSGAAVTKMLRNDIGRLPVVSRKNQRELLGYLGRASVMAARLRRLEEEHIREQGLMPDTA